MNEHYIDSNTQLIEFCLLLKNSTYLSLDTEFIREKTYYPELALIQIANDGEIACIDPYKITDFSPLIALFNNSNIVKIFHSPSQDLELFAHFFKELPQNIFDTQLAASLLGIGNQIGYADLVNKLCSIQLDKKHTRTDWSRRPLSKSELDYALDDVRYLGDIYQQLMTRLESTGRLSWLGNDFTELSCIENYQTQWNTLWKKLKGSQKLNAKELNYADQITQWREQQAQRKNLPKKWIIKDEDIVDIARLKPQQVDDFKTIRSLNQSFLQRHANTLIKLIKQADEIADDQRPKAEKFKTLSANQQAKSDCLMAICKRYATLNDMSLNTLATKKDIDSMVQGKPSKLLTGWRFEMAGKACQQFLNGHLTLSVDSEGVINIKEALH